MGRRVVVVGGSAAGMSAASVAKRRDPSLQVIVFERTGHVSYSACGMPYRLAGEVETPMDRLVALDLDAARDEKGVDVRVRTSVRHVDPVARTVAWRRVSGDEEGVLEYDDLVLAPGTRPVPGVPIAPHRGVFVLRTLEEGIALEAWIAANRPRRVAIVGMGFIAVELAEAFLARGMEVSMLGRSRHVLRSMLDAGPAERVARALAEAGVHLVVGSYATAWEDATGVVHRSGSEVAEEGSAVAAVHAGDRRVPTDLVVVAAGTVPDARLARMAGCGVREQDGAILTDDRMRTNVPGVWACGDAVAFPHKVTGERILMPLALHANRSGRIVGTNLAGGEALFPGVLGTMVTRFQDLEIGATGLSTEAAQAAGLDVVVADAEVPGRAGYMPGVRPVFVTIVAERGTRRVLGVQLVGGPGSVLRIDAAAAILWQGGTVGDVEEIDFAYNPPFSPVWDPLAIAARVTAKRLARA